jgi:hypothetical protein
VLRISLLLEREVALLAELQRLHKVRQALAAKVRLAP